MRGTAQADVSGLEDAAPQDSEGAAQAKAAPRFGEWCVLELLGHRRLGGFVSEQEVFGTTLLRIDVPNGCTGVAAKWCPKHGTCSCADEDDLSGPDCPLHMASSEHGEGSVTQFYGPRSIYSLTPTTEEVARAVAERNQPQPIERWEMPKLTGGDQDEEPWERGG